MKEARYRCEAEKIYEKFSVKLLTPRPQVLSFAV